MILKLAFDVPRHTLFDYFGIEGAPQPPPGTRVLARLGKAERIGVVMEVSESSDLPLVKIKGINEVLDGGRLIMPAEVTSTILSVAHSNVLPVGRLTFAAIPPVARKATADLEAIETTLRPGLAIQPHEEPKHVRASFLKKVGESRDRFSTHLVTGLPGSGKTQVTIEAVARTLASGRTCLVLVPEISEIGRWQEMITERAPGAVVLGCHGTLPGRERMAQWRQAMGGGCHVVVGTRAAALIPMQDLGLIVVSGENDPQHRTEHGIIYSARDVAARRALAASCPLLMTAAVPSLEIKYAAHHRRISQTLLPRPPELPRPGVRIVDIGGRRLFGGISNEVEIALRNEVQKGGMGAVLVNRRHRNSLLYCPSCRSKVACPSCNNPLMASDEDTCACRLCGHRQPMVRTCPDCGSGEVAEMKAGSSRIAEALSTRLPEAKVMRIDADTDIKEAQERIDAGQVDIVVGTRTLLNIDMRPGTCCVSDADTLLHLRNFHAPGLLLDTLTKLAWTGHDMSLLIQTRFAGHHVFEALSKGSYDTFAFKELEERKAAGLPPFRRYAKLVVSGDSSDDVAQAVGSARYLAQECVGKDMTIFEIVPSPTKGAEARMQLLISSGAKSKLLGALHELVRRLDDVTMPGNVSWGLEIDPEAW